MKTSTKSKFFDISRTKIFFFFTNNTTKKAHAIGTKKLLKPFLNFIHGLLAFYSSKLASSKYIYIIEQEIRAYFSLIKEDQKQNLEELEEQVIEKSQGNMECFSLNLSCNLYLICVLN